MIYKPNGSNKIEASHLMKYSIKIKNSKSNPKGQQVKSNYCQIKIKSHMMHIQVLIKIKITNSIKIDSNNLWNQ